MQNRAVAAWSWGLDHIAGVVKLDHLKAISARPQSSLWKLSRWSKHHCHKKLVDFLSKFPFDLVHLSFFPFALKLCLWVGHRAVLVASSILRALSTAFAARGL
jgi:hypothetical protein